MEIKKDGRNDQGLFTRSLTKFQRPCLCILATGTKRNTATHFTVWVNTDFPYKRSDFKYLGVCVGYRVPGKGQGTNEEEEKGALSHISYGKARIN